MSIKLNRRDVVEHLKSEEETSLYKALAREGNPEYSTVVKVINALGLRLHAARAQS